MEPLDIRLRELGRDFGGRPALCGLSCTIPGGQIYGLLGPNGAGKTTLLKILAGLLSPTSGQALVCGLDVARQRQAVLGQVGTLIETPRFYDHLTAADNLEIHLAYMGREGDVGAALARVGLENVGRKPVGQFSLGMRQRLAIARAMVHRPRVMLLDEPTNGLDPIAMGSLRQLLLQLEAEGVTLVVSSHILSQVEHTARRVGVLNRGRLVLQADMQQLKAEHPEDLKDYLIGQMGGGAKWAD